MYVCIYSYDVTCIHKHDGAQMHLLYSYASLYVHI